jgi:hypothetical protein
MPISAPVYFEDSTSPKPGSELIMDEYAFSCVLSIEADHCESTTCMLLYCECSWETLEGGMGWLKLDSNVSFLVLSLFIADFF